MGAAFNVDQELTCRELVELVTDYLEHALDARTQARFEAHLAECDGCRDYLDQMRRTIALLGLTPRQLISTAERERLLALFRHARGSDAVAPEGRGE